MEWDDYYSELMHVAAKKSKDPSRKVGCLLVGPDGEIRSTGFNDLPRKVMHLDERYERPEKYFWCEHAERNSLYNAARCGTSTNGCRAFVTMFPCADCTRGLIQCGIVEVICEDAPDMNHHKYGESFKRSAQMFAEAGLSVRFLKESKA
jgi:dCMP deaminase